MFSKASIELLERTCEEWNVSWMTRFLQETLVDKEHTTKLGSGGYGQCFLVHMLERTCVVKTVPDLSTPVFALQHDITALHDIPGMQKIIIVCSETLVLNTEYAGEPLDKFLAKNPCTRSQRLNIVIQLTNTLRAIHSRGWIHLDVKPQNICIQPSETGLRVTLIYFGLALLADHQHKFQKGAVSNNIAPDVLGGGPCSQKSDVYSVALLLTRLLDGRDGLVKWVNQCLRKNPMERYSLDHLPCILQHYSKKHN